MSLPAFGTIMSERYPAYEWEAIQVQAADENGTGEYTLTTYKLWNASKRDADKGWVFFQHGASMSGTSWLYLNSGMSTDTIGTSPFISFADLGYDVYIGNNRGQEVSFVHSEYAYTSENFWEFTIEGYAEDVLANMKAAYTSSGNTKGHYYGYSLGTA